MSELTLLVLRIGFLLLLWFFVFAIVYALRSDLFGQSTRKTPAAAAAATPSAPNAAPRAPIVPPHAAAPPPSLPVPPRKHEKATIHNVSRLVITAGPKEGLEVSLGRDPLTIGRAPDSGLVIRDDYTSTHHAKLLLWNEEWMVQDLDSTNGTFLGGKRISSPTQITLGTPIKVGATSFELRR
ncbi:FHA domain-containing protein FhaB/FipA [Mycetocola zhadangensis]|uniref:FHA domain-containing protein n=1 Tax=Mycetocola zhadangensis TaxID=1164595 RepID=A0A3L7J0S3_9MICO|nr:FHA domain-containing protein [Mycetocola zhadangensis]RLQ84030.1 FHA domain-containing protein [Mycetocola zhadangensis]GGE96773.1 phosphopeptide-binding protein [Mycetocola zhadangensis]